MGDKSKIQWVAGDDGALGATWNPTRGCTIKSSGCFNCYAMRQAARFSGPGQPYEGLTKIVNGRPVWTGEARLVPEMLDVPLRWKRPRRIFVDSMSDLFHEMLTNREIAAVFGVMAAAWWHTFIVLTKRAKRLPEWFAWAEAKARVGRAENFTGEAEAWHAVQMCLCEAMRAGLDMPDAGTVLGRALTAPRWPLPNVWLLVSAEDQATLDERVPPLLATPATVRGVSLEPLLGPVDLGLNVATCDCCPRWTSRWIRLKRPVGPDLPWLLERTGREAHVADVGVYRAESNPHGALSVRTPAGELGVKPDEFEVLPRLDWIIVGGESGPGARPFDVAWARSVVEQGRAAGVATFVKQLGARPVLDRCEGCGEWEPRYHGTGDPDPQPCGPVSSCPITLKDSKGGDMAEWPEWARVREYPRVEVPHA